MTEAAELYADAKPDISPITGALIPFSEQCLRARNNFLPHAVVVTDQGEVKLVAPPEVGAEDCVNAAQVLPALHECLRSKVNETPIRTIGIAENVTITLEGKRPTKAIKVQIEHRNGFAVALYRPFEKKFLRGYVFGSMFAIPAQQEVHAWVTRNDV